MDTESEGTKTEGIVSVCSLLLCTCDVGSAQCSGCVVYGPGAMAAI